MIRLYWSDAFQSVYVSQPTTAFLNLLIPLLFQSILSSLPPAILDVRIDLVSIQNCSPVSALSSYLFIEWCACVNASDFRVNCLSPIISYIRNIANAKVGRFWQSTTPVSHLSRANMHPGIHGHRMGRHLHCPDIWDVFLRISHGKRYWLSMKCCHCICPNGAKQYYICHIYTQHVTEMPLVGQKCQFDLLQSQNKSTNKLIYSIEYKI